MCLCWDRREGEVGCAVKGEAGGCVCMCFGAVGDVRVGIRAMLVWSLLSL